MTTGFITTYHYNFNLQTFEQIMEEFFQVNGTKEGEYKKYYENGKIILI